jgi:hypothetical protein
VAGLDDLIEMKRRAARAQDLEDVRARGHPTGRRPWLTNRAETSTARRCAAPGSDSPTPIACAGSTKSFAHRALEAARRRRAR